MESESSESDSDAKPKKKRQKEKCKIKKRKSLLPSHKEIKVLENPQAIVNVKRKLNERLKMTLKPVEEASQVLHLNNPYHCCMWQSFLPI